MEEHTLVVEPWTLRAERDAHGDLSIEVRLDGEPHAEIKVRRRESGHEADARSRLRRDMDY